MTNLNLEELRFMVFQLAKTLDVRITEGDGLDWEDILEKKDNERLNKLWIRLDEEFDLETEK